MKYFHRFPFVPFGALFLSILSGAQISALADGTAFTYQGRLSEGGSPANGLYDFRFRLAGDALGNNYVGSPFLTNGVAVTNGLFTAAIDFGAIFNGNDYWLEIDVRHSGGSSYTALDPLQAITPAPASLFAAVAGSVAGGLAVQQNTNGAPNLVGGASVNYVSNTVVGATIAGGGATSYSGAAYSNSVVGIFGTVSGGAANTAGGDAVIGGGVLNAALGNSATVSGGDYNNASGPSATVSGGSQNTASGSGSTISGGASNSATNIETTVSGGADNMASGFGGTVGGGTLNTASGDATTVGGGQENVASGEIATVGGGNHNTASSGYATAAGGSDNLASGNYSTVSGGQYNNASAYYSTVGGGYTNVASGLYSTVSGGYTNVASGNYGAVGGGDQNLATGSFSTVPGGINNLVSGSFSFAAGSNARNTNNGSFVWADPIGQLFYSTADNQFSVRAVGGVRFVSASSGGVPTAGVTLAPGSGSWSTLSDRKAKENLQPVNAESVLAAVTSMPLATWNYKTQDKSIRHIGPMAQDFAAAFHLGENDTTISTVDEGGVALAAIQGLTQKLRAKEARIEQLEDKARQLDSVEARLKEIEKKMQSVQSGK